MRNLDDLTLEVSDWVSGIIPDRDPYDTATKIVEEASELLHALHHEGDVASECADILILLLDVALLRDINLQKAFEEKMEVNRNRMWQLNNGSLKHSKES